MRAEPRTIPNLTAAEYEAARQYRQDISAERTETTLTQAMLDRLVALGLLYRQGGGWYGGAEMLEAACLHYEAGAPQRELDLFLTAKAGALACDADVAVSPASFDATIAKLFGGRKVAA